MYFKNFLRSMAEKHPPFGRFDFFHTRPKKEGSQLPMTKRRIRVLAVSFLAAAFAVTAGSLLQGHAAPPGTG